MSSDLRAVLRSLLRQRTTSGVILLTLLIGTGALATAWAAVRGGLLAPLPFHAPGELSRVRFHPASGEAVEWESSVPELEAIAERAETLQGIEGWGTTAGQMVVRLDDGLDRVPGQLVTAGWFDLLGLRPLLGRPFEEADDRPGAAPVALISEALWRTRFGGDPEVLGRTLEVAGTSTEIVGVLPARADLPVGAALWLPLRPAVPENFLLAPQVRFVNLVARCTPSATAEAVRTEIDTILAETIHPQLAPHQRSHVSLRPLDEELRQRIRTPVWALFFAALLVLVSGAANVGGLLAVRASRRRTEWAVRRGLGARSRDLWRFGLLDAGVLTVSGGILGALVAPRFLDVLVAGFPGMLFDPSSLEVGVDATLLSVGASFLLALVFGAGTVLWARRLSPAAALRSGGRELSRSGRSPILRALAGIQIATAVVVALAAGLQLRSLRALASIDPGFGGDGVLSFQMPLPPELDADPEAKTRTQRRVLEQLRSLPGVEAAGGAFMRPLHAPVGLDVQVTVEGREDEFSKSSPLVNLVPVSAGWFATADMAFVEGAAFRDEQGPETPPRVVLTRALARRLFDGAGAVGQRVKWGGPESSQPWLEVAGVVEDVHWRSIEEPTPSAFIPFTQSTGWGIEHLAVRSAGDPWMLVDAVRRVVREEVPGSEPLDLATLDDMVGRALAGRTFALTVVGGLAFVALLLSGLGLYGLIAHWTMARRRELGLRMALGATPRQVFRGVLEDGGRLALWGVGLGTLAGGAIATLADLRLAPHLAGVGVRDPATFLGVALVVLGIAAIAAGIPARRASRCDPAVVLRED